MNTKEKQKAALLLAYEIMKYNSEKALFPELTGKI